MSPAPGSPRADPSAAAPAVATSRGGLPASATGIVVAVFAAPVAALVFALSAVLEDDLRNGTSFAKSASSAFVFDYGWSRISGAVVFAAIVSLTLVFLIVRGKLVGRSGAIACLATLGSLCPLLSVRSMLWKPVFQVFEGCVIGTRMWSPPLWVILLALLASGGVATLAQRRASDALIRALALGSCVVVGCAAAVGVFRLSRPDADTYLTSLPVRTLAVGQFFRLNDGTVLTYSQRTPTPLWSGTHPRKSDSYCRVDGGTHLLMESATCAPLQLWHDARAGLWLLERPSSDVYRVALRDGPSEHDLTDVYPRDAATSIAPPTMWTAGALLGLVLQLVAFAYARRLDRQRGAGLWVEGTAHPDGWVVIPGQPPVRLSPLKAIVGPVVMRMRTGGRGATYRDPGSRESEACHAGTLEEVRDALQDRATTLYAFALTSGLLCAAPLLLTGLGGSR